MTPHLLQAESPTNELAMLLVGDYKSGKSYLAATAPGNILFLEMDRRLKALATHPNVKNIYGLEFSDNLNAPSNVTPTAFNEMLDIINKLEASPRLQDLHSVFKDCGDKLIDTIVFDSVQSIADAARRYVMFSAPDVAKTFVMGQKAYRVAKTFHAWGGEMEMVTGAILQARALLHCKTCLKSVTHRKGPDNIAVTTHTDPKINDHPPVPRAMNVIAILHECMEEDERSTQENPIYTGKIEVYPRRYNSLLMYFNEVWRLRRESGRVPTIQVDPDNKFVQAATALGIQSDKNPADIQAILRTVRK
ncbi:MAG TPA: AAA family ATPase [Candidatus Eisenbacteria bacterium]|nr:AAA family ATPase [Candidatus Eisenbacteria bacterium]